MKRGFFQVSNIFLFESSFFQTKFSIDKQFSIVPLSPFISFAIICKTKAAGNSFISSVVTEKNRAKALSLIHIILGTMLSSNILFGFLSFSGG